LDILAPLSERLRRLRIEHRLVIAGDGPMSGELKERCQGAVFTGKLCADDLAAAMASADIFLFPSATDLGGKVVLEAQASGLPVLVTGVGGPSENMVDGETGFVCEDLRAFARRVSDLAWNPDRRADLSQAARRYAVGRRWSVALNSLYRTYREATLPDPAARALGVRPAVARPSP
jgi:glycosyltransferase involved in cell wall biosynthesis